MASRACRDIRAAIAAGAAINFVRVPLGLHCPGNAADVRALCRENGIAVLSDEGTLHGLLDEAYVGVPCPSVLDGLSHAAAALIARAGGWDALQALLVQVKAVADKHAVAMRTVGLRWQIDQGVVPTLVLALNADNGADASLFCADSFLDAKDMAVLSALGRA